MKLFHYFLVKKLGMYKGKIFSKFFLKTGFYGPDKEPEPEP